MAAARPHRVSCSGIRSMACGLSRLTDSSPPEAPCCQPPSAAPSSTVAVFVSAASGSLGSALRDGTFNLVASLSGADSTHYFTLDAQTVNASGTVKSQLDVTQANGGTINATTGAFSATEASFIEGAGSTGGIQALVHGRILSAGQGVAGLFTTTQAGTVLCRRLCRRRADSGAESCKSDQRAAHRHHKGGCERHQRPRARFALPFVQHGHL